MCYKPDYAISFMNRHRFSQHWL